MIIQYDPVDGTAAIFVCASFDLWPRDRSLKKLQEWCSFELHTVVVDTGEAPLEDDEFQE